MKKTLLALSLSGIALTGTPLNSFAMSKPVDPTPVEETVVYPQPDTKVSFIAIGDSGTGKDGQYKVAAAMEAVCQLKPCDFAIGLGDNIYESGVDGVDDIQFDLKFEDPYKNLDFPFYMALGNHDNSWIIGGDGAKTKNFVTKTELNEYYWQEDEILGFFHIEIQGDQFHGTAYTVDPVSGEYRAAYTRTMQRQK